AQRGTTWYPAPENIVECWVHPITGKRLNDRSKDLNGSQEGDAWTSPAAVKEMFLASNLPPLEAPDDYAAGHRPRLDNEYREWLASGDNWLPGRVVLADSQTGLRIAFPLPGTKFYLDPDLPEQGRRLHLRAEGPENL